MISKGKQAFTPKARLIQILGEHLIKDATVGLLELAKNSYDADATKVEILMSELNIPSAKIVVRDNGTGMDLDTFLNKWMNPASGHKQQQKDRKERTKLGRLPLGEKGVGRFAAQQIGSYFRLTSKILNTDVELHVEINWGIFEDHNIDLSDVNVEYELRPATIFRTDQSGTLLEIEGLKTEWKEADVRRIANSLKRMKSPFKGATDFDVILNFQNCPEEFTKYENIEITDILEKAHYKLFGVVENNGVLDFDYDSNYPGQDRIHRAGTVDLNNFSYIKDLEKPHEFGGFIINLHHYNKSMAAKSGFSNKDVEEICGVSIYRDGIRILPYGEKGNDWLKLDNRRIQKTDAIGNDTIIGMVEINQTENVKLTDKTNREGLIENRAYHQLERMVLAIIETLETEKGKDKSRTKKDKDKHKEIIDEAIIDVKSKLSDVAAKVVQSNDAEIKKAVPLINSVGIDVEELKKQIDQTVEGYEDVNKILFNLAGTGLAAERFTHEFARLISGSLTSLERLRKLVDYNNPKVKKEIDTIYGVLEALRNDIRLLGPMFYIKKVAKAKPLQIKEIIQNTLSLQQHLLEKSAVSVRVEGDSFEVLMREGSCMQVFNNLIDNAIFWLSRKSETDNRQRKVILDSQNNSVYISDNGPGVVGRWKDKIFEPFFSMKGEDGRGLGLYIAKEILEENNWGVFLVDKEDHPDLLQGASFKVAFKTNGQT
jgi:signal transduction histidine kinase